MNCTDIHPSYQTRDGPVEFEKDTADPFGIEGMIAEVTGGASGAGQKRYGIQEAEDFSARGSKRARVSEDDSEDERRRR